MREAKDRTVLTFEVGKWSGCKHPKCHSFFIFKPPGEPVKVIGRYMIILADLPAAQEVWPPSCITGLS